MSGSRTSRTSAGIHLANHLLSQLSHMREKIGFLLVKIISSSAPLNCYMYMYMYMYIEKPGA